MSCLAARAATVVLCVLCTLNMCVTLTLADELPYDLGGVRYPRLNNLGLHSRTVGQHNDLSSRTVRSTKLHGSKQSGDLRMYAGAGKVYDDAHRSHGEWDERYGINRHMDRRERYSSYKDSLSRKPKKQLDGSKPQQKSSSLEQFCNRTEVRSLPRCVPCFNAQNVCPVGYIPHKKGPCLLSGDRRPGCSYDCLIDIVIPECCTGYWGSQCLRKYETRI